MTKIFFSYRRLEGQQEFVQDLVERCDREGFETWLDTRDIPVGSLWEDEIFQAIHDSDYAILCMSPQYFESENCLVECYTAQGYMKHVLPIVLPDVEEPGVTSHVYSLCKKFEETAPIQNLNFLDFHRGLGNEENRESQIQRLLQTMKNPTPADTNYVGFVSYRRKHAKLATHIADMLTTEGMMPSFIFTKNIDIGLPFRPASWNALLKAKFHIVVLSLDITSGGYLQREILLSRSRKVPIIPIMPEDSIHEMKEIRDKLAGGDKNFDFLNACQWVIPKDGNEKMMKDLIGDCKRILNKRKR